MKNIHVTSVQELLDYLGIFDEKYGDKTEYGDDTPKVDFWFRGVSNKEYKLLPKFLRGNYYTHYDLGILQKFKKEAGGYINSICGDNDLNWLQYAQHYGVPTRLLDFSASPLVALFFCCSSDLDTNGALWVLNKFIFDRIVLISFMSNECIEMLSNNILIERIMNKFYKHDVIPEVNTPKYPVSFIPSYIDRRMETQLSRFLIWDTDDRALDEIIKDENIMKLEGNVLQNERKEFLAKLIIPSNRKVEILNQLDLIGINEKTIFPGLDGIGKYIDNHYNIDKHNC